jgi:hypothetical protein
VDFPRTIQFYADVLRHRITWTKSQNVESMQSISADVLRRHLVELSARRNPGAHAAHRAIRAFLNRFALGVRAASLDKPHPQGEPAKSAAGAAGSG